MAALVAQDAGGHCIAIALAPWLIARWPGTELMAETVDTAEMAQSSLGLAVLFMDLAEMVATAVPEREERFKPEERCR